MKHDPFDSDYENKYDSAYTQQRVDKRGPYDIERVPYNWEEAAEAHALAAMRDERYVVDQLDDRES